MVSPETFPELQPLIDNWQVIRDEAVNLQGHIKSSEKNNDAGFNTFLSAVGSAFTSSGMEMLIHQRSGFAQ